MKDKFSEIEVAENVVTWLQEHNWEVYQEVPLCRQGGIRADIYACMGNITWAIETKTTFGLQVLAQAWEWKKHAHYVSIAVPYRKYNNATYRFERELFKNYGIGLLYMQTIGQDEFNIKEEYKSSLNRIISKPEIHEKYKSYSKAGNSECSFYSAFKQTRESIINQVKKNNPILFSDLIDKVDHHYKTTSTAKSCLRQYIDKNIIPELEIFTEQNKLFVRLKGTKPEVKLDKKTDDFSELNKLIQEMKSNGTFTDDFLDTLKVNYED